MGFLRRLSSAIGGLALCLAVAVDFASVVLRHVGVRFYGSIEIIQFCVLAAISSALILASIEGAHASVHLLVTRVGPRMRGVLGRLSDGLTALAFILLLTGGAWVAADLWPQDERSDLLRLPFAPARLLWAVALVACIGVVIHRFVIGERAEAGRHD